MNLDAGRRPRRRRLAGCPVVLIAVLFFNASGARAYRAPIAPRCAPRVVVPGVAAPRSRSPLSTTTTGGFFERRTPLLLAAAGMTPALARQRITAREIEVRRAEADLRELRALLARDRQELKQLLKQQPGSPTFRETTTRSLVKAIGWRIIAGFITFCSSFYFTRQFWTSLAIVGSDFISKVFTMFIGERLFNRVKMGRSASGETVGRSVVKALIWRAVAFLNTATISGLVTASAGLGAQIASSDAIIKTTLMVVYDQAWSRIDWGKELENVDGDGI